MPPPDIRPVAGVGQLGLALGVPGGGRVGPMGKM